MKKKASLRNNNKIRPLTMILGIAFLLIIFGVLYFNTQLTNLLPFSSSKTIQESPASSPFYINSTLGFKLDLPSDWTICDPGTMPGVVGIEPQKIPTNECSSYTITIAKYYLAPGVTPVKRRVGESFFNYVQRLDYAFMEQLHIRSWSRQTKIYFKDINDHTILRKVTNTAVANMPVGANRQVLYIEDNSAPDKIIVITSSNGDVESTQDDPNLLFIANHLTSIPITTGDISGYAKSISWNNEEEIDTPIPNFPITVYSDQKKVVMKTKADAYSNYVIRLKPGKYYIKFPNGVWQPLTVFLGAILTLDPALTPESPINYSISGKE